MGSVFTKPITKGTTMKMLLHFLLGIITGGIRWVWFIVRYFIKN